MRITRRRFASLLSRFAVVLVALFLFQTACEPQLNFFKQNDRYYSVFGFLNASVDSQFIRVEPLRDTLLTSAPRNLHAKVTITDLTDNRIFTLQDSIFTYLQGIAHNFYTTTPIIPNHTYRLEVDGPNGAKTTGQVTVPDSFPHPFVSVPLDTWSLGCSSVPGNNTATAVITIKGIKRLIAVNAIYHVVQAGVKHVYTFYHLADTTHGTNGLINGNILFQADYCRIYAKYPAPIKLVKVVVEVAAGNPDWPNFLELNQETEAIPNIATNITGGTGLLGGIVTDTVNLFPYDGPPTPFGTFNNSGNK